MAYITIYATSLWLGAYLVRRSSYNRSVLWIGLGLVVYAMVAGMYVLSGQAHEHSARPILENFASYLLFIPALFWIVAFVSLFPAEGSWRDGWLQIWKMAPSAVGLALAASILLGLSFALLALQLEWVPESLLAVGIGCDLCILGYAIARLDAFDLGEALLPDFLRSLDAAILALLIFAGPVVVTIGFIEQNYLVLWILLLTVTATAILFQVFTEPFQAMLDRFAFGPTSSIGEQRAELRAAAEAVPKVEVEQKPELLDDAEFTRLTRRALSRYGDLNRLAASPLTQLSCIQERLAQRGEESNTLTRSTELKRLLTDAIAQLKPDTDNEFGTSDEWRYYNALYFPYVVGLRPYSRRAIHTDLDDAAQAALNWFQSQVPERTLHNWQNGAAKLVAQYLREKAF
ncbi:MAG: hypothetical protein AAF702_35675 [Chloroflexota bacterium]